MVLIHKTMSRVFSFALHTEAEAVFRSVLQLAVAWKQGYFTNQLNGDWGLIKYNYIYVCVVVSINGGTQ